MPLVLRLRRSVLLWRLRRRPLLWWSVAAAAALLAFALADASPHDGGVTTTSCPDTSTVEGDVLADRLPDGTRALAVPAAGGLPLQVGDHVDLVAPAVATVEGAGGTGQARTVADDATVVALADDVVTVAVARADAADAALAAAQGGTTLVLRARTVRRAER